MNKSTRMICLIYFSMVQFNDMKFWWRNLNINDLMLINLHISLITKRFFRSFDRHSDKTVTLSELLQDINNFSNKIVDVIRKSNEFSFKIVRVITIVVWIPLIFFTIFRHLAVELTFLYSLHHGCTRPDVPSLDLPRLYVLRLDIPVWMYLVWSRGTFTTERPRR